MPEFHAKLSPSKAEQWMNCPGSVVLCDGMPEQSSPYAAEGTHAHAVAEAMLRGIPMEATAALRDTLRVYVDDVRELANVAGAVLHVETKVTITEDCWGTMDAAVWQPHNRTLNLRDLKFGAGVPVEVSDNLQLKLYALGGLKTFKYPAKVINIGICQPRIEHPDGKVRTRDFDVVDLIDFHADVKVAVARVEAAWGSFAPDDPAWIERFLHPTEKGCRWCLAAPKCPKLREKAQSLAKQVFTEDEPYNPLELASTLDFLPILEGWIKNVREFAYGQAERGVNVPHYKLVEKRASRKWRNEAEVSEWLRQAGIDPWDRKLISITEAEKSLGKGGKIPDTLTVKESSGHTLVHESDNRPAVRLDAAAAFSTKEAV